MWPTLIVVGYVGVQHGSQFSGRTDFVDVDPFILQGAEESFRSGIVQALALAVHTDPDFVFLQQRNIVRVGEMPALIAVDDFRLATRQGTLKTIDDKGLLQRGRQLVIHNIPTVPVDDDKQVHEAFRHVDIGNVNAPHLIGTLDRQMPQQIGLEELRMVAFGQIWLRKQGVDAHDLHQSARPFPINQDVIIPVKDLGDRAVAPSRFIGMDPVDQSPNSQLFRIDELDLGIPVDTSPIDAQQLALPLDRDLGIILLDHFTGFACDVRLVFLDLFFSTSRLHRSTGQLFALNQLYALLFLQAPFRHQMFPS